MAMTGSGDPVGDVDADDEIIRSADLDPGQAGQLGDVLPKRQWWLALALLSAIVLIDLALLIGVMVDQLTTDDAVALVAALQGPLVALLGAAVAFYYPRT